ncbi:hypothetical protein [Sphingomonas sp. BK580]|uniref:hypothetical protein n=1 Tax=Sphingomonas sp. BK580 TaxID=2586972 RepID=UPI001618347A|nr:hypothetical protein [Sphingomonas sp. BK580]MBB3693009.1 hypothetical protein [Sphingomonas sp. BK580]
MPAKKPAPAGYDFSAFRRGALSDITGPNFSSRLGALAEEERKRPTGNAVLRSASKPRGVLTRLASDAIKAGSRALGSSERDATQRAARFEEFNHDWNPLAAADTIGTQAGYALTGDRDFSRKALAEASVATALGALPEVGAPIVKALGKTKAGKRLAGALTEVSPIVEDTAVDATAKLVRSDRKLSPVRTKDGAIPQPAPAAPRGVLSTPDETTIPVRHYSSKRDLTVADPAKMGTNPRGNMGRDERSQKPRVYLGEARGAATDYSPARDTGIPPFSYDGAVPKRKVVDVGSELHGRFKAQADHIRGNPDLMEAWGLPPHAGAQKVVETLQEAAGFPYRRFSAEQTPYGATLHSFEPVPLTRTPEAPLAGQPLKLDVQGPDQALRDTARGYMWDRKLPYQPTPDYLQVDPQRARAIADAYEQMPHAPNDPEVRKAYGALSEETLAQYAALKQDGYSFNFYPRTEAGEVAGDYYPSPFDALRDLRGSKHMKVFPTDDGYGAGGITEDMIADNPLLQLVPDETWGGQPVRVNDVFRAVHDAMGHGKNGVGFRAAGEENAWAAHRAMYTPAAQRAMTTETRGQNSWLNFGPHGDANRNAATEDTVFAPQKIGLLPDWVLDPAGMPPTPH